MTNNLLETLRLRFAENPARHPGIAWKAIQARLEKQPEKLRALGEMERTGGEPDVIGYDDTADAYLFCDCSAESPSGRRNLCYDEAALAARKANKPAGSAAAMAVSMGIALLTEAQYQMLQSLGAFDTKTSSWIETPEAIRRLGGALFGDRRYDHTFIYHNGADSYYAARGFRGILRI